MPASLQIDFSIGTNQPRYYFITNTVHMNCKQFVNILLVKVLSRHRNYYALVNILLMLCSTTGVWFKISIVINFVILPNYHDSLF